MARVRFTDDFDFKPTQQTTIGYLKGMEETVKRECADQAIAAGKATEIHSSRQPSSPSDSASAASSTA